jgi:hypothetical protein
MSRHTKNDYLVIQAELVKFGGYMAVMAIQYKHPIRANCPWFCILLEDLFKPGKANLVGRPSIFADTD